MSILSAHVAFDGEPGIQPAKLVTVEVSGRLRTLAEIEIAVIKNAIDHHGGNYSRAAKSLGIGRSTIYRKIKGAP